MKEFELFADTPLGRTNVLTGEIVSTSASSRKSRGKNATHSTRRRTVQRIVNKLLRKVSFLQLAAVLVLALFALKYGVQL